MAQLIVPGGNGDTPPVVGDKTRALPANQGLNDHQMWLKIDTELASALSAGTLILNQTYGSIHGN